MTPGVGEAGSPQGASPKGAAAMKALVFSRQPAKFAAAMVAGRLSPGGGARVGPLALRDVDPPELPGPEWVRVRPRLAGICGSDLATIDGTSSRWFEPIVSFPFTPGHEVVGELDDGTRVAIVPVLSCVARGIAPVCDACAAGRINHCERIGYGDLEPGLQCGFCESTGGGWSTLMVAHTSQLVAVPDDMDDEAAVLIEPAACAVHAASLVQTTQIALIGSGTLGLLTLAALRRARPTAEILATAKHPLQRDLARELGADVVVAPSELERLVRGAHRVDATRQRTARRGRRGRRRLRRIAGVHRTGPADRGPWRHHPRRRDAGRHHGRPHAALAAGGLASGVPTPTSGRTSTPPSS